VRQMRTHDVNIISGPAQPALLRSRKHCIFFETTKRCAAREIIYFFFQKIGSFRILARAILYGLENTTVFNRDFFVNLFQTREYFRRGFVTDGIMDEMHFFGSDGLFCR